MLKLTDINPSDITLTRSGVHLVVSVTATGHQITSTRTLECDPELGHRSFTFANSTTWNRDQIMQNAWWNGRVNDTIAAMSASTPSSAVMERYHQWNADVHTLDGGAGYATMTRGTQSDKFVFQTGFGQDTINDFTVGAASHDVIEFQNSMFANFGLSRRRASRSVAMF